MGRGEESVSKTVDERVVEMRFDNKQFESNVQTSLSTLDKLKKSLDMNGATKGSKALMLPPKIVICQDSAVL